MKGKYLCTKYHVVVETDSKQEAAAWLFEHGMFLDGSAMDIGHFISTPDGAIFPGPRLVDWVEANKEIEQ